jgi:hypothetical protein
MNNKLLSCLMAGALALASPAFARGGGGHGGGGHGGGGMHGGGMGMGGGMRGGGWGGGMHIGGMGGGPRFSGARFASTSFVHAGFSPRFSSFAHRGQGRFIHHRFHRFAFFGTPYAYAAYDDCWRRVWTPYGLQWANLCGDYGY